MSDLFFARTSDPETSHLAAANLNHMDIKPAEKLIYQLLKDRSLTDEQLVDEYHEYARWTPGLQRSPSAIRTMRVNMYRIGLLRVTGLGVTRSGNKARLWTALEM